jgi:flagellar biosynthetic protein FlhB
VGEGSKTEKATPKKRRDERKKGNVFLSQDAIAVATLLASFAMLWVMSSSFIRQLSNFIDLCFTACGQTATADWHELALAGVIVLVKTVLPIVLVTALCGVLATFFQTKLLVSLDLLKPKFSRINPLEGFKRLFSLKSLVDALKGILKITILLVIIYLSLVGIFSESSKYLYTDVGTACAHLFENGKGMIFRIVLAFVALAAFDFMFQWWDYERKMRMSKQEIKEEYKQTEGDPQIKSKIKEMQRRRAQTRMMQQVPGADVVIRNPTHFAVALRYHPEEDEAPIVLAKGQDHLAMRIVQCAEENDVICVENVPLARALYAQTELNQEIPPALYTAVAEVLVYIFRLDEKKKLVKNGSNN